MKTINYYVIGGQYQPYCYGEAETLQGAKRLAAKHDEYWDNWQGWHRPKIYSAVDCVLADTQFFGEQMVPKDCAVPVAVYDMDRKLWEEEEEVNRFLESLADEDEDDEEEPVLQISKIAIKSETFCTPWNGSLYCVDICEDAEERSAWVYRSDCGVKTLMGGEDIKNNRDEFLNVVFSNLPDYIEVYEEDIEKLEEE